MSRDGLQFLDPENAVARQAWDDAVKSSVGATVFHTTAWMDVVRRGLGIAPRFAYLPGPGATVRALIPLFCAGGWVRPVRWLNLPQSCSADPLAADEADAVKLLEQLAQAAATRGATALVLQTPRKLLPGTPAGWEIRREQPLLRHVIDIKDALGINMLARIQRRQREKFRSLQRRLDTQGVTVRMAQPEDAARFAHAVHHISLRKHGHLGMPARFFQALLEFLPGGARLATIGPPSGPPLAFTVTLWGPGGGDFLYGAGLPTKDGADAFTVCLGTEIDAAIRAGLGRFDLHETSPVLEGLIISKERWGAERVDGSYLIIAREGAESGLQVAGLSFALAHQVFRFIPASLSLRIAGPVHRALQ